tara:strand:- start:57156 stop:61703 length:4548 start_codon:yes stop_codon:yes gene_type:complete
MTKTSMRFLVLLMTVISWQLKAQFTENFDTSTTLPTGWSIIDGGSSDQTWKIISNPSGGAQSGTNVADIRYGSDAHDDFLITPAITVAGGVNDQISFYVKSRSSSFLENYDVLLSTTNNTDPGAFTEVLKSNDNAPNSWTRVVLDLTPYLGDTVYVAVHATDTDQFNLYVDTFVNDGLPTCTNPADINILNITDSTANASWMAGIGAANYDWEVVPQGNGQGNGVIDQGNTTGLTAAIDGLSGSTPYDFYIKSDCETDYASAISFTTQASPPGNDECINATALTVNPNLSCGNVTSGSIAGATDSGIDNCGGTEDDDVWYSFVATNTTHIVELTNITGGTTDLYHAIYDASPGCGALAAALKCSDPNISTTSGLTIGNTYYIQVYSWTDTPGQSSSFDICVGTIPPPPTNDECANAISLTVNPDFNCGTVTSGTVESATNSNVNGCGGTEDDDVWYSFVATNTTHSVELLNVAGSTTDMYHAVYDATPGCENLTTALTCSDADSSVTNDLTIGNTYYVQVYTWTSTTGQDSTFDICIGTPPPPPTNDDCANAEGLTVNGDSSCTITASGTVLSATNSGVDSCVGTEDDDVWYSFVATSTYHSISLLNIAGSSTNLNHAIYDAAPGCGALGEALMCSDPNSSSITGLTIGNAYLIQVYTSTGTTGQDTTFDICVGVPPAPPSNDNCSGATSLTVNPDYDCVAVTAGTIEFALNSGEQNCGGTANDDVWYSFVATRTGHRVSILNVTGSATDMYHAVYDAAPGCASLEAALTCSDSNVSNTNGLTIGNTYYVQVYSWTDTPGQTTSFDICIGSPPPPPANNDFANAEMLTVNTVCNNTLGTLIGATPSSETPFGNCGSTDGTEGDVWYSFVAPDSGNAKIETSVGTGANLDTVIVLYAYNEVTETLTQVECNDDGAVSPFSAITITDGSLISGDTYYIRVHEYNDDNDDDFNICVYYPVCAGTTITWSNGAWVGGVAPTNVDVAIINDAYSTLADGSMDACALIVNNGETLTISAGDYVSIGTDITVNGTLNIDHEGSLVQIDDTSVTNNNGSINVEKITPALAEKAFMILGSPMSSETREAVYGTSYIVRNHVTGNFVPHPDVATMFPMAENFADDDGNNWLDHSGLVNPAEGYLVFPQPNTTASGSYTLNYDLGTLNNGVFNYPLIFNGSQNGSPNILANPYASAIDADLFFLDPNNADINALYFWEHITPLSTGYPGYNDANFSMGDISVYSESMGGVAAANGGTAPTSIISSGQGFAVKASAAGTAVFNNSMRVNGPNDTYRSPQIVDKDRLWIKVFNNTYGLGSTALIGFSEETTSAFDDYADIRRLATPVSLYSELETGEQLVINALDSFEPEDSVNLSFVTQVTELQEYRISLENFDGINLDTVVVYLLDTQTRITTSLSENDYTFQSDAATYSNRFTVFFRSSVLDVTDFSLNAISVFPNPAKDILNIASPTLTVHSAVIYDMSGRKVYEANFNGSSNYQLNMSALPAALYFVEISTENGLVTKRVIKE